LSIQSCCPEKSNILASKLISFQNFSVTLADYLPVLIQILLAIGMGLGILAASHLFGQKATAGKIKDSPYECGLAADTKGETRYSVKFYVTAMLFIIFDIDVVFLIPWVLTHRDLMASGIPVLGPMLFFTFVLAVGLIYELKSGALEWEK
jgi:NADH-quinone oxidoreductase subunit A